MTNEHYIDDHWLELVFVLCSFARYFVVTCFWPFKNLFLRNDAIVGLMRSFLYSVVYELLM